MEEKTINLNNLNALEIGLLVVGLTVFMKATDDMDAIVEAGKLIGKIQAQAAEQQQA